MFDVIIKNGLILDGTGSAPYRADVAAKGGEIIAIGLLESEAAKTVDAEGLVVSPGFIDLHTHSDMSFLLDPTAQSKVRQGVTLELAGNCGSSYCAPLQGGAEELLRTRAAQYTDHLDITWTDFGGYLDAVQQAGSTVNLAVQVGHGTVRSCVLGQDARAPNGEQMEQMKALIAESLDAGAMGFSTGLYYAPGYYARLDEVIELAAAAGERGKLYSSHIRSEGAQDVGLFVALNEAIEVGRRTGVRVEVSHVKCIGPKVWGRAGDVLALFERTRKEGIDVAGDQYPYTASSTSLTGAIFPRWALDGGRDATLQRMADPYQRQRMIDDITVTYQERSAGNMVIARYIPDPGYEGRSLEQIAQTLDCAAAEAGLRLYERGDAQVVNHSLQEADVEVIARYPMISIGSDGNSLSTQGVLSTGKPHPRSYGTNPRFLARFVRERQLISLPEAVRRMTTLPASRLGLTRRGRIAPGYAADLVVFDPDTVADTATFEAPHSYAEGIPHVAVNGVLVIENGQFTGLTPGKVIRGFDD